MQTTGQHSASCGECVTLQFSIGKETIAKRLDALRAPTLRGNAARLTRIGARASG